VKGAAWLVGLALFLEAFRLTALGRMAAHPDLLLGVVVLVGLYRPAPAGALAGFGLGLLRDLSAVVADEGINIEAASTADSKNAETVITLTLETKGLKQLSHLLSKLEGVPGVYNVTRLT